MLTLLHWLPLVGIGFLGNVCPFEASEHRIHNNKYYNNILIW